MSLEIAGWIFGLISGLVAFIAIKSKELAGKKAKDYERRINAIDEARSIREHIAKLDDSSVIDEFRGLYKDRRR